MPLTLWRITRSRYARVACSGEGARRYGGRWGNPGRALVYSVGSLSLAVLEFMANLDAYDPALLEDYVVVPAMIDEAFVATLDRDRLPEDWREFPHPPSTRAIGDRWLETGSSLVLAVPSAVVPRERNYLVNPQHEAMSELSIEAPEPLDLEIDPRLMKGA